MKKIGYGIAGIILILVIVYQAFPKWILNTKDAYDLNKADLKKETFQLNGQDYYYLDNHNDGKPVLVFLHGFSDRKNSWADFVEPFSKDYRLVIPDLLGHGENDRDFNISHDFVTQSDFVDEFVTSVDINQFSLIGISMGGGIASHYAVRYPEKTKSYL